MSAPDVSSSNPHNGLMPDVYAAGWKWNSTQNVTLVPTDAIQVLDVPPYSSPIYLLTPTKNPAILGKYDYQPSLSYVNGMPVWTQADGDNQIFTTPSGIWVVGNISSPSYQTMTRGAVPHQGLEPDIYNGGWLYYNPDTASSSPDSTIRFKTAAPCASPLYISSPNLCPGFAGRYDLNGLWNGLPIWQQAAGPNLLYSDNYAGNWKVGPSTTEAGVGLESSSPHNGGCPDIYSGTWQYLCASAAQPSYFNSGRYRANDTWTLDSTIKVTSVPFFVSPLYVYDPLFRYPAAFPEQDGIYVVDPDRKSVV